MEAYRTEVTLPADGKLSLDNLPFRAGDRVEVIVLGPRRTGRTADRYPLRGTTVRYLDPTGPVAEADWEASS
jgi:hypothetical protein